MTNNYKGAQRSLWQGRESNNKLYLHEKVIFNDLLKEEALPQAERTVGILGYACDEGVKRNSGRIGAKDGPDAIRKVFSIMPNHLPDNHALVDFGNIICEDGDMETCQEKLATQIQRLKEDGVFCFVLGGGHDVAYGHYKGLKRYLGGESSLGIINFDAHFDLRSSENGNNSGTPFFQIGSEYKAENKRFPYLCLGIRKDANDASLYDTASVLGVNFLEYERFQMTNQELVEHELEHFLEGIDSVYVTIDLDGFSSAYAPGVSAPSPIGFTPELVMECLKTIIHSKKLIGIDLAEMNPKYDIDRQTAKLAAGLMHFIMHRISLF